MKKKLFVFFFILLIFHIGLIIPKAKSNAPVLFFPPKNSLLVVIVPIVLAKGVDSYRLAVAMEERKGIWKIFLRLKGQFVFADPPVLILTFQEQNFPSFRIKICSRHLFWKFIPSSKFHPIYLHKYM